MTTIEWDLTDADDCPECGDIHLPCPMCGEEITEDCFGGPCASCWEIEGEEGDHDGP